MLACSIHGRPWARENLKVPQTSIVQALAGDLSHHSWVVGMTTLSPELARYKVLAISTNRDRCELLHPVKHACQAGMSEPTGGMPAGKLPTWMHATGP